MSVCLSVYEISKLKFEGNLSGFFCVSDLVSTNTDNVVSETMCMSEIP